MPRVVGADLRPRRVADHEHLLDASERLAREERLQIFDVVVQAPEAELRIARPEHGLDRRVAQRLQRLCERRRVRARQEAVAQSTKQYCRLLLQRASDKSLAARRVNEETALHGPRASRKGSHGCGAVEQ